MICNLNVPQLIWAKINIQFEIYFPIPYQFYVFYQWASAVYCSSLLALPLIFLPSILWRTFKTLSSFWHSFSIICHLKELTDMITGNTLSFRYLRLEFFWFDRISTKGNDSFEVFSQNKWNAFPVYTKFLLKVTQKMSKINMENLKKERKLQLKEGKLKVKNKNVNERRKEILKDEKIKFIIIYWVSLLTEDKQIKKTVSIIVKIKGPEEHT